MEKFVFILLSALTTVQGGGYPESNCCGSGGGYSDTSCCPNKYPYLPAPPGQTPPCSRNGQTFCEKVDNYPLETIQYLLYKWGSTYSHFIRNEIDQDFIMLTQNYSFYPKENPNPYYGAPSNHFLYNNSYNNQPNTYLPQQNPGSQFQFQRSPPQPTVNPYHLQAAAALIPPIVHSFWWNHRDKNTNRPVYPYLAQHRFHRFKRQTSGDSGQLCTVSARFTVPLAAMNNQGNWMYVVNMEGTQFRQQVRAEMCDGPGSACNGICSIPDGYTATCRQKYVQKRLVALEGTGAGLRTEPFWFPHCCLCEFSRVAR